MASITPFLWLNDTVDEAVSFYTRIFKDAKVHSIMRMPGADGGEGRAYFAAFELHGQPLMALNGGPMYSFTPAISLYISCEGQDEVDYFWDRLSEGGAPGQCGWLTDKFDLSWQVIPTRFGELMGDPSRAQQVNEAMLKMTKIDIAALEAA